MVLETYVLEGVITRNDPRFPGKTFEIVAIILPYLHCHVYKIYRDIFYLLMGVQHCRMGWHIKDIGWLDYFVVFYGVAEQNLSEIQHSRLHRMN